MYLSKSDFKIAQDCATKLYYKKKHYPSAKDDNLYMKLLAEGGFMVEKIAKLLQEAPIEMEFDGSDHLGAFHAAQEALKGDNITLCEATLISNGKLARVDILRKRGNEFDLVEVKAKSYDSKKNEEEVRKGCKNLFRKKDGGIKAEGNWQEYLEDVTFQVLVLRELYPDSVIHPYLCMPDKAMVTHIDNLHSQFRLRRVSAPGSSYERYEVDFTGDIQSLRADNFLVEVLVADEVDYLMESVRAKAEQYVASLQPDPRRIIEPLSTKCAKCEYRKSTDENPGGYRQCWGDLALVKPHILALWNAGRVSDGKINDLIRERKVSLFDVTEDTLANRKGEMGAMAVRQQIQLRHTRDNTEWRSEQLTPLMQSYEYPLHFIDFETTALAIPYHSGMRPYEPVAFQWSCHTIEKPGRDPVHREWINIVDVFPNFEFAETLMKAIGTSGTVFKYAAHETTILNAIRRQMGDRRHKDDRLLAWLDEMSAKDRIVDMMRITIQNYYHPLMEGSNSIKDVVEAVWKINPEVRAQYPEYVQQDADGIVGPYASLPPLEIHGTDVVVAEGTGAMRAYEAMMYGIEKDDDATREQWKRLLLQYCKLDTAAMVMIWKHWTGGGQ